MHNIAYMKWNEFINTLLIDFRLTGNQLAQLAGLTQTTIGRIKNGKTPVPYPDTIGRIEKALNIRIDDSDPNNIKYNKLERKEEPANSEAFREQINRIPVISKVYAGLSPGLLMKEEIIEYVSVPYHRTKNVFAVRVVGDSMNGTVSEGDTVVVDMEAEIFNDNMVIVRLSDGRQYVKRFKRLPEGNMVYLYSDNQNYPPILLNPKEIEQIYRVVGIYKSV